MTRLLVFMALSILVSPVVFTVEVLASELQQVRGELIGDRGEWDSNRRVCFHYTTGEVPCFQVDKTFAEKILRVDDNDGQDYEGVAAQLSADAKAVLAQRSRYMVRYLGVDEANPNRFSVQVQFDAVGKGTQTVILFGDVFRENGEIIPKFDSWYRDADEELAQNAVNELNRIFGSKKKRQPAGPSFNIDELIIPAQEYLALYWNNPELSQPAEVPKLP